MVSDTISCPLAFSAAAEKCKRDSGDEVLWREFGFYDCSTLSMQQFHGGKQTEQIVIVYSMC